MGKKLCIIVVLLSVIILNGCTVGETKQKKAELSDTKVPAGSKVIGEQMSKLQWDVMTVDSFTNDYQQLMKDCPKEFCARYPIEEEFFLWFYGEYGKNIWKLLCNKGKDLLVEDWYRLTGKSVHVLWLNFCKEKGFQVEDADAIFYK